MGQHVIMGGTGMPLRESTAQCEGCGNTGTIGRAVRTDAEGQVTEVHRFCADCWAEQSARYRARWAEQDRRESEAWIHAPNVAPRPPSRGAAFESATWHTTLEFVREINRALRPMTAPTPEQLAAIAADIRSRADDLEGPMPMAVQAFLQDYGAPAPGPGS